MNRLAEKIFTRVPEEHDNIISASLSFWAVHSERSPSGSLLWRHGQFGNISFFKSSHTKCFTVILRWAPRNSSMNRVIRRKKSLKEVDPALKEPNRTEGGINGWYGLQQNHSTPNHALIWIESVNEGVWNKLWSVAENGCTLKWSYAPSKTMFWIDYWHMFHITWLMQWLTSWKSSTESRTYQWRIQICTSHL